MAMVYECDHCGKQEHDLRGWITMTWDRLRPILCSAKCAVAWLEDHEEE